MTTSRVTHVMPCHQLEWVWKFRLLGKSYSATRQLHTHVYMLTDPTASLFLKNNVQFSMPNIDLLFNKRMYTLHICLTSSLLCNIGASAGDNIRMYANANWDLEY